jgi:acyl-CoA thioesterase
MTVRADMIQGHGTCHGGFLFGRLGLRLRLQQLQRSHRGLGCSIDYIAPARLGDTLNADCTEQSRKGRTGNYDVRIENQQGQLIALFHGKSYKVRGTGAGAGEPE